MGWKYFKKWAGFYGDIDYFAAIRGGWARLTVPIGNAVLGHYFGARRTNAPPNPVYFHTYGIFHMD